jgi:ParB family chromosome partitioning protein
LIPIEDEKQQLQVLQRILEKKLSVRQVEDHVRIMLQPSKPASPKTPAELPDHYQKARTKLSTRLESEIEIKVRRKGKGSIVINFNSEEEFNKLLSKLES